MARTYTCPTHGLTLCEEYCPECIAEFSNLPDPATMTRDERVAEMTRWGGVVTVPFGDIHSRLEALIGRPVQTIELGLRWQDLCEEARTHDHPHPHEALDTIITDLEARGVQVILAVSDGEEATR